MKSPTWIRTSVISPSIFSQIGQLTEWWLELGLARPTQVACILREVASWYLLQGQVVLCEFLFVHGAGNCGISRIFVFHRNGTRKNFAYVCCQEHFLEHICLSLLCTHILKTFGIGWDLLDSVKKMLAQRPSTLVLMMINSCSYVY